MKNNFLKIATLFLFLNLPLLNYGQVSLLASKTLVVKETTTPPEIITAPQSQTQCFGSSISFSVLAEGTGLSYQWRRGLSIISNDAIISGATTSVLTINELRFSDGSDDYNVIISGSKSPNAISSCFSMIVSAMPYIISPTISQTVCAGTNVVFPVMSKGIGSRYQWRKGNVLLVNGKHIKGATSSELTLLRVSVLDSGSNYNVVITGMCSPSIISKNMSLAIIVPPVILNQPISKITCINGTVSFSVLSTGMGLKYQWRNGTDNLMNDNLVSGANESILTLLETNETNISENYNVVLSNSCSSKLISSYVGLNIVYNTLIVAQPISQTYVEGQKIIFDVLATGTNLSYQWRIGTTNLYNTSNVSGVNSAVLIILSGKKTNAQSNYNVVVRGDCSSKKTSLNVSLINTTSPILFMKSAFQ